MLKTPSSLGFLNIDETDRSVMQVNAEAVGVFEHISAPTVLRSSSGVKLPQDSVTHPGLYKYPRPDIDDIEYGRSPNEVKSWCQPYFEGEKTCDDARCRAQWVKCLQQANRKDINHLRDRLRIDSMEAHCSRFQRDTFEDLVKAGGNTAQEVLIDLLRFHHNASLEMKAELDDEMCLEELLKTLHKLVDRDLWISADLVHELLDILSNDGPKFYEALNTLGTLLSNVNPDSQAFKRGHEFLEERFRRFWAKHAADEQSMRRRVRDELPVFRERSQAFRRERIISTGPALRNEYDIRSRCQLPREKQEDEERAVRLNFDDLNGVLRQNIHELSSVLKAMMNARLAMPADVVAILHKDPDHPIVPFVFKTLGYPGHSSTEETLVDVLENARVPVQWSPYISHTASVRSSGAAHGTKSLNALKSLCRRKLQMGSRCDTETAASVFNEAARHNLSIVNPDWMLRCRVLCMKPRETTMIDRLVFNSSTRYASFNNSACQSFQQARCVRECKLIQHHRETLTDLAKIMMDSGHSSARTLVARGQPRAASRHLQSLTLVLIKLSHTPLYWRKVLGNRFANLELKAHARNRMNLIVRIYEGIFEIDLDNEISANVNMLGFKKTMFGLEVAFNAGVAYTTGSPDDLIAPLRDKVMANVNNILQGAEILMNTIDGAHNLVENVLDHVNKFEAPIVPVRDAFQGLERLVHSFSTRLSGVSEVTNSVKTLAKQFDFVKGFARDFSHLSSRIIEGVNALRSLSIEEGAELLGQLQVWIQNFSDMEKLLVTQSQKFLSRFEQNANGIETCQVDVSGWNALKNCSLPRHQLPKRQLETISKLLKAHPLMEIRRLPTLDFQELRQGLKNLELYLSASRHSMKTASAQTISRSVFCLRSIPSDTSVPEFQDSGQAREPNHHSGTCSLGWRKVSCTNITISDKRFDHQSSPSGSTTSNNHRLDLQYAAFESKVVIDTQIHEISMQTKQCMQSLWMDYQNCSISRLEAESAFEKCALFDSTSNITMVSVVRSKSPSIYFAPLQARNCVCIPVLL